MREIRTLRSTWRGLETWHGRRLLSADRRASPRPYLGAPGGESPLGDSTPFAGMLLGWVWTVNPL